MAEHGRRAVGAPFKLGPVLEAGVKSETGRSDELAGAAGLPAATLMEPAKAFECIPRRTWASQEKANRRARGNASSELLPMVADDWQFEQVRQMQDFSRRDSFPHANRSAT